ncbi:collagen binding domain-containing protein [Leifsonia sp. NPDC058292]|uniref:MSCRAMM family protein n=1 Tax=Leifsonia sp. NPDC058292 TaxID=3346428 RepID=UPI0036D91A37
MRLRPRVALPVLLAAFVAPLILTSPAAAATTTLWAGWTPLTTAAGVSTTTVTVANNPALVADVTSDSRTGQIGVISGASTWLAPSTPVGAKYGSSKNQPYLNLRPKADTPTAPSTTTYAFRTPTPPSGWTFVLGDIDADKVQVRAIGPDGVALTAAQLGFRGGFNYCVPGVCTPTTPTPDVPAWDAATATLSGDPVNNKNSNDTTGAAGWFEPSARISSLTFVYTRVTGLPVFQTWFASVARDISGTVADQNTGPVDGVPVTLTDRDGAVVATATTAGGGAYSFPGFLATDGYTVSIGVPAGKIAVGSPNAPADLTTTDAVVEFTVRDVVPVAVSGTVLDSLGAPIAGATVTIGGQTATTDATGAYLFDTVAVGDHTITVTPIDGYTVAPASRTITVPAGSEDPITDQDFVLTADPDVSGTVTASGAGVSGVTVTATPNGGGSPVSVVTGGDGSYTFPRVPSGGYTITVEPPSDFIVSGTDSRPVTVATSDITGVDFALARTGSVSGAVLDSDGNPVAGAKVTVDGPSGTSALTTDPAGQYGVVPLAPGTYTITLTVPDGYTTTDPLTKTVTITDAGETIVDQNYTLVADAVVPPTTPPTTPPGGTAPAGDPDASAPGEIADTGSSVDGALIAWIGAALLAAGATAVGVSGIRRRRRA